MRMRKNRMWSVCVPGNPQTAGECLDALASAKRQGRIGGRVSLTVSAYSKRPIEVQSVLKTVWEALGKHALGKSAVVASFSMTCSPDFLERLVVEVEPLR